MNKKKPAIGIQAPPQTAAPSTSRSKKYHRYTWHLHEDRKKEQQQPRSRGRGQCGSTNPRSCSADSKKSATTAAVRISCDVSNLSSSSLSTSSRPSLEIVGTKSPLSKMNSSTSNCRVTSPAPAADDQLPQTPIRPVIKRRTTLLQDSNNKMSRSRQILKELQRQVRRFLCYITYYFEIDFLMPPLQW